MPRLLQRTRRPGAASSGRSGGADVAGGPPLELPPYEPPAFPMDDKTKQKLAAMARGGDTDSSRRQYGNHLSKSVEFLSESVASINDILFERRRSLANMVERRRARGIDEKPENEVSLEEHLAGLEATIAELTDSSEEALRWVIDCRAELVDQKAVLEKVMDGLSAQQPRPEPKPPKSKEKASRRRVADGSDDDEGGGQGSADASAQDEAEQVDTAEDASEDVPPITGIKELFQAARKAKMDEYEALSAHQRYAIDNDYIAFKRKWHDALHPEDQIPVPDPSTWFDEHGRPTKDVTVDVNEDDDLVVEREILDLKCPLSLQIMKEPYSNHQCKHTFEKTAIMEFIRTSGGTAKCPVCSKVRVTL